MKLSKMVVILLFFVTLLIGCENNSKKSIKSKSKIKDKNYIVIDSISDFKDGLLYSEGLALKVGELYLRAKYGNEKINNQLPLTIKNYEDTLWQISGTFQVLDSTKFYVGGTAEIVLSKIDGKVVKITHYK